MNDFETRNKLVREFLDLRNENILLSNQIFAALEIAEKLPSFKLGLNAIHDSIIAILRDGKYLSMGEVALSLEMKKYEVTKPVSDLVKLGIVNRFQKEDNLRNVYVKLTDYGNQIVDESTKITMSYWREKLFSVMTKEELCEMIKVIERCNSFLLRIKGNGKQ